MKKKGLINANKALLVNAIIEAATSLK